MSGKNDDALAQVAALREAALGVTKFPKASFTYEDDPEATARDWYINGWQSALGCVRRAVNALADTAAAAERYRAEVRKAALEEAKLAPVWNDPGTVADYTDLLLVLCRVLPDREAEMPRACNFSISTGDHAVGDTFVSIGFHNKDTAHPDDYWVRDGGWQVAGWNMMQDCWQDATGYEVIGWRALIEGEKP